MRIVIPGGTGQVGQILARHFHSEDTTSQSSPQPRHPLLGAPSPDPGEVFDVFLSLVRHGLGGTTAQADSSSPGFTKPTSSAP